MTKTPNQADQRREEIREQQWPGSSGRIWRGPNEKGWWAAPRILPLLLHLARDKGIVGKLDASFVYVELLSRSFGQGLVEIRDEDEHAYHAGYTSSRARRTWQERMRGLERAGFIEVRPKGNRAFGFVLIVHPSEVISELRRQGRINDRWWSMLQQHLVDARAPQLEDPLTLGPQRVVAGGAVAPVPSVVRRKRHQSGE